MAAIGIDLGTTNSCVAVWQPGNKVAIIPNERGSRTTPSYVAFDERKRFLGDVAKNNITKSPTQTIYDSKRLIGRSFNDNVIRENVVVWPFTLVDVNGSPRVDVLCNKLEKQFAPEEISAMMILKMKQISELFLGDVKDAVIAVPVSFTDKQRQATIDAGRIAGLNVLGLIHETTAAVMTYGSYRNIRSKENVFVFNVGGGHVDVSVVTIEEGPKYTVISTTGASIGGEDFTNALIKYLAEEFRKKEKKDVFKNKKACQRLRTAAERAKINLTSLPTTFIEIDSLMDNSDLYTSVAKECLDGLCQEMISKILALVDDVLKHSKMSTQRIDEVILVGGSSRVPEIQRLLMTKFPGKELNLSLNLDEAVAHGAALLAAKLSGGSNPKDKALIVTDVASRFILHHGNDMLSYSNDLYPCHVSKSRNAPDAKNRIHILGECLCALSSSKLPVLAEYTVNTSGKLKVNITEVADRGKQVVTYEYKRSSSGKVLEYMISEAKSLLDIDGNEKQREDSRHQLEKYAYSVRAELQEIKERLRNEIWGESLKLCNETLIWLEANEGERKDTFDKRLIDLQNELQALKMGTNVKRPHTSNVDNEAETRAKKLRQANEEKVVGKHGPPTKRQETEQQNVRKSVPQSKYHENVEQRVWKTGLITNQVNEEQRVQKIGRPTTHHDKMAQRLWKPATSDKRPHTQADGFQQAAKIQKLTPETQLSNKDSDGKVNICNDHTVEFSKFKSDPGKEDKTNSNFPSNWERNQRESGHKNQVILKQPAQMQTPNTLITRQSTPESSQQDCCCNCFKTNELPSAGSSREMSSRGRSSRSDDFGKCTLL